MVPTVLRTVAHVATPRTSILLRQAVASLIPAALFFASPRCAFNGRVALVGVRLNRAVSAALAGDARLFATTPPTDIAETLEELATAAPIACDKLARYIASLESQLKDPAEAEVLKNKGNALNTVPKSIKWRRGMTEVNIPDYTKWDDNGNAITVIVELLDPEKDFPANAKLYFKRAGKITRAWQKVAPMVGEQEADLERWRGNMEKIKAWQADVANGKSLSESDQGVVAELREVLVERGVLKSNVPPAETRVTGGGQSLVAKKAEERRAFKRKYGKDIDCFRSPSGYEVIAGRSSTMNEYVSLKLAKGDMPWFHTDNGIPGSHVLIKAPWSKIADEDFEFAAKIAAYHSKKKDSNHVPVMYCKGGDVKKPKGSKKGTVMCTGPKYQMFVTPGLPPEEDDA